MYSTFDRELLYPIMVVVLKGIYGENMTRYDVELLESF
jgi:hypothetical protein